MRSAALLIAAAFLHGCASAARLAPVVAADCESRPAWDVTEEGRHRLGVALVVGDASRDGWDVHGASRLRTALTAWNQLRLPLRLVPSADLQSADIRVIVVRALPAPSDAPQGLQRYRAGVTRLDTEGRRIVRAQVGVAEVSPLGVPYSVEEQIATLIHELGHALGLPHAPHSMALMSALPRVNALTPADQALAVRVLRERRCADRVVAQRGGIDSKP